MKHGTVTIHFKMKVRVPTKPLSKKNQQVLGRLGQACRVLEANARANIKGDDSHLADITDSIESLANIVRRAKAVS